MPATAAVNYLLATRCASRELHRKVSAFTTWIRHLFPLRLLNRELWQSKRKFARDGGRMLRRPSRRVAARRTIAKCTTSATCNGNARYFRSMRNRNSDENADAPHIGLACIVRPHAQRGSRPRTWSQIKGRSDFVPGICRCHVKCVRL